MNDALFIFIFNTKRRGRVVKLVLVVHQIRDSNFGLRLIFITMVTNVIISYSREITRL